MKNQNINPGFKHSPIGPIPIDWDMRPIINFGTVVTGNTPSRQESKYWGGNICWATAQDFKSKYITVTVEKINDEGAKVARILPKGSVLVTCIASIGNNAISLIPLATNQQINSIIPNSSTIADWIYYCFENSKQRFLALAGKTAVPIISKSVFEKVKIQYAPLPEQQKISAILSTWDEAISKTQQLIVQLKERNRGLQQHLLTGKLKLKEHNGSWRTVKLGDVTRNFSRRNNSLIDARIYSVTNSNGFVLQADHFEREVAGDDLSNYKIIKKNEFAYNPARINVGSIAHFKDEIGVISSLYVCFSTTEDLLDDYLSLLLKGSYMKQKLNTFGEGGVRIYLWYPLFEKIKIKIPNIEEQNAIVKILTSADNEIKIHIQKLETLKQQKKGLMQKLLTGKIRVKIE